MWHHLSELLTERLRHADWHQNIEAATAAENVTRALHHCFPNATSKEITFLSYASGIVTLGVSHPALHQAVREQEVRLRTAIQEAGTNVNTFSVRLLHEQ